MQLNAVLRTLYASNGTYILLVSSITPLFALYAEQLNASIIIISQLAATLFVGKVVGLLLLSWFGNNTHEHTNKNLFVLSLYIQAGIWFSLVFATGIGHLFIAQLSTGIAYALGVPAFRALVATHRDPGRTLYDYSSWELILAVTTSTGAVAGGVVVQQLGFPALFSLLSITTVLIASYTYYRLNATL